MAFPWHLSYLFVSHPLLTPEIIALIRQERHSNRLAEGGGGMCHYLSEYLANEYGWRRESGSYLSAAGEVISGDGHYWNYLPDGSLLDATADQWCEGYDIRVIAPTSSEFDRYRWAFTLDYHPDFPTGGYLGPYDHELENQLREDRGDYWWVPSGLDDLNVQIYEWRRDFYCSLTHTHWPAVVPHKCTLDELDDLTYNRYGQVLPTLASPVTLLL